MDYDENIRETLGGKGGAGEQNGGNKLRIVKYKKASPNLYLSCSPEAHLYKEAQPPLQLFITSFYKKNINLLHFVRYLVLQGPKDIFNSISLDIQLSSVNQETTVIFDIYKITPKQAPNMKAVFITRKDATIKQEIRDEDIP